MSFLTLIEKGGLQKIATATVATFATEKASRLSRDPETPIDEDRLHAAVKIRRAVLLKAVRSLVADGLVNAQGTARKAIRGGIGYPENRMTSNKATKWVPDLWNTVRTRGNRISTQLTGLTGRARCPAASSSSVMCS